MKRRLGSGLSSALDTLSGKRWWNANMDGSRCCHALLPQSLTAKQESSMRMLYRDGTSGDDYLFDQPEDLHRVYVAGCMNLNPDTPPDWPISLIERLLFIRRNDGLKAFHAELRRTLSPSLSEER
jgi:hypothetical protein